MLLNFDFLNKVDIRFTICTLIADETRSTSDLFENFSLDMSIEDQTIIQYKNVLQNKSNRQHYLDLEVSIITTLSPRFRKIGLAIFVIGTYSFYAKKVVK